MSYLLRNQINNLTKTEVKQMVKNLPKTQVVSKLENGVHIDADNRVIVVLPLTEEYYSQKMRLARVGSGGGFQKITDYSESGFQKVNISLGRNKTPQEKEMTDAELAALL
jgi:hypothetical protein